MPYYFGELLLYWCPSCNLPVLGKTCACGAETRKIDITPPGDIRPAFQYDIDLINKTTEKQFGLINLNLHGVRGQNKGGSAIISHP